MKQTPTSLSVALIAYHEADRIARTLESVKKIADEIIVVDSYSSDNTCEIAKSHGAIVYQRKWSGFSDQKNYLFSKCSKDFILSLDCDEVLSNELAEEIKHILKHPEHAGYLIKRQVVLLDKILKRTFKDNILRLIQRDANPTWSGTIHESLTINGSIGQLNHHMIHYSYRGLHDQYQKTLDYAWLAAKQNHQKGKRFHWCQLIIKPCVAFIKHYILKGSFLDGSRGLFAAESAFIYTYWKYLFLLDMERK